MIDGVDLDLPEPVAPAAGAGQDWLSGELPAAVARLERAMICRALAEADGNRAQAARRLGIQRQLLYAKMERYGLGAFEGESEGDVSAITTDAVVKPDVGADAT